MTKIQVILSTKKIDIRAISNGTGIKPMGAAREARLLVRDHSIILQLFYLKQLCDRSHLMDAFTSDPNMVMDEEMVLSFSSGRPHVVYRVHSPRLWTTGSLWKNVGRNL